MTSTSTQAKAPVPVQTSALLTADDLSTRWQVPTSHVYRLARDGRLPVVQLGRYKRFTLAAIEAFESGGGTSAAGEAVWSGTNPA